VDPFITKLQGNLAEVLQYFYLRRLSRLNQSTCVGFSTVLYF